MNQFFELFGGPIAFLLSIVSTLVLSRRWRRYRSGKTRGGLVAILYWGPLFLMACMLLHNVQNAYRAVVSIREAGVFNFYFYSLQLFGFVVAYQSYLLLLKCRRHVAGEDRFNPKLFFSMGLIVLTTLPTFAFTPIGIIPSGVLFLTAIFSISVHRAAKSTKRSVTTSEPVESLELEELLF